jgi:hypothetical protein
MNSEAHEHTGEALLDHLQAFIRGDIEIETADLITPDNVLWRSGPVIAAASAPGEELGYLTDHRIFACLSENRTRLPIRRAFISSRRTDGEVSK